VQQTSKHGGLYGKLKDVMQRKLLPICFGMGPLPWLHLGEANDSLTCYSVARFFCCLNSNLSSVEGMLVAVADKFFLPKEMFFQNKF